MLIRCGANAHNFLLRLCLGPHPACDAGGEIGKACIMYPLVLSNLRKMLHVCPESALIPFENNKALWLVVDAQRASVSLGTCRYFHYFSLAVGYGEAQTQSCYDSGGMPA